MWLKIRASDSSSRLDYVRVISTPIIIIVRKLNVGIKGGGDLTGTLNIVKFWFAPMLSSLQLL